MSNDISNYNNWLDAWNDFYEKEKELVELDPNAALVSSVDAEGNPNARVILIKDVSNKGFVFYTNYQSQKGKELFHNNKGHLTWYSRERKVYLFVFKVKYKRLMLQFQTIILHLEIVMLKFQRVFQNNQKQLKAEKYLMLNLKNLQMIMKVKRFPDLIIGEE